MTLDRPYVQGSRTSEAAAASLPRATAVDARAKVFAAIHAAGIHGLTRDEVAAKTGLSPNCVRPRVCELFDRGLLLVSDELRRSPSGRSCEVLASRKAVEEATAAAEGKTP